MRNTIYITTIVVLASTIIYREATRPPRPETITPAYGWVSPFEREPWRMYHKLVTEMLTEIDERSELQLNAYGGFTETKAYPKIVAMGNTVIPFVITDLKINDGIFQTSLLVSILKQTNPSLLKAVLSKAKPISSHQDLVPVWLTWWENEGRHMEWK